MNTFARLYDLVMGAADRAGLAGRRRSLASGARGLVLEIGAGTGLQFPHYPANASVVAIEPDVDMLRRARSRQRVAAAPISLVVADGRALPFRDGTFDTAISALTFCTIPDPARAAREMRRVLRTSGTARLLEHVSARHRALALVQALITPLWCRIAGGCHLDRPTAGILRAAGFDVRVDRADFDDVLVELVAVPAGTMR